MTTEVPSYYEHPHGVDIYQGGVIGGGFTHHFLWRDEASAKAAYEAVGNAIAAYRDRTNDRPTEVAIDDDFGSARLLVSDLTGCRYLKQGDLATFRLRSALQEKAAIESASKPDPAQRPLDQQVAGEGSREALND